MNKNCPINLLGLQWDLKTQVHIGSFVSSVVDQHSCYPLHISSYSKSSLHLYLVGMVLF